MSEDTQSGGMTKAELHRFNVLLRSQNHTDRQLGERLTRARVGVDLKLLGQLLEGSNLLREVAIGVGIEHINEDPALTAGFIDLLGSTPHAGAKQGLILILRTLEGPPKPDQSTSEYSGPQVDALFSELSRDRDADVRYQAFVASELREHQTDAHRALLIEGLDDPDGDIRIVAAQGIARLQLSEAIPALQAHFQRARGEECFQHLLALVALGAPDLLAPLVLRLTQGSWRFATIQALGEYGDPAAAPDLLGIAKGWFGDPIEKVTAAQSLSMLGVSEGDLLLKKFAKSRKPEVRGPALNAITTLGWGDAQARLIEALQKPKDPAAAFAATLLVQFPGAESEEALQTALKDPREEVRDSAAEVLSQWKRSR